MKKILILIFALVLCFAMASCEYLAEIPYVGDFFADEEDVTDELPDEPSDEPSDEPEVDADLKAAYDYVHQMTKTISEKTGANYSVTGSVKIGEKTYTVTWTVSDNRIDLVPSEDGLTVSVVVPEPAEDINYTLSFVIYNEKGESLGRDYAHVVPAFAYNTFDEYAAAEDDEPLVITGIVSGVFSKTTGSSANGLYIQDLNNEGGYYVYNLTDDPNGVILPGMTVKVKGVKDTYNGTYELINASVEIVDETITPVVPVDYTELLAGAAALNDADLVKYQGMLVTVKGVTVGELGDNGYYYFTLGAHKTYLRISSSNNATTKEALETIKSVHAANYGNVADVTGVISLYNGNFYLSPVSADAFSNIQVPERTDAEKIALELGTIKLDSKLTADKVIELLANGASYSEVVFTWSVVENAAAVLEGNTLTLTVPDEKTTVELVVTATCGEATDSKTFYIELSKEVTPVAELIELGSAQAHNNYTADKYLAAGIITEVYNDTYGNMKITDSEGNVFTIYGTYSADGANRYDAMESKPVAGDYVVLLGVVGQYNDTPQMKNAWIQSWITPTSVKDAIDLGAAKESNDYTGDKVVVTGTITEVYNTQYGNMYITDAEGNVLTIYGAYDSTGANRYDAMTTKPVAGDTVTILGVPGNYKGTAQIKNGWILAITAGTTDDPGEQPGGGETPNPEEPNPNPNPTEGNVLTSDKVFASVPVEDAGAYPSYANYNGTYTCNGFTITTVDVLRSSHGVPYVFQVKKASGVLTISDVTVNSVTIILVSSYDSPYLPTITIGDVELTVDSASVIATKEATGTKNSSGYDVSRFTISIALTAETTGDLVIKNTSNGAMYFESIELGVPENTTPACEHANTTTTTVEVSCTENGSVTVVCDDCGETISTEITAEATGHEIEENIFYHPELVEATCVTPGVAVYECANCDYYYTEATPINPEAHGFWGAETIVTEANCATETNGLKIVCCANEGCTATEEQEIYYFECHEWDVQKNTEVTCTTAGEYYAVCTLCQAVEEYYAEASGHYNWFLTCGETGECMECGEQFTLEHDWYGPTCTEAATCFNCWAEGEAALGHNFVDGYCTVCDEIDPDAHFCEMVATDKVVAPTCTESGYVVYACAGCGKTENIVNAEPLNHVGTETTTTTTQPTCTAAGTVTVTCVCGEVLSTTEGEAALGHDYDTSVTAPTCTAAGYTTYSCGICDDTYTEAGEAATGHNYVDGICGNCNAEDPDYYFEMTIAEALQAPVGKKVKISGMVSEFYQTWNTQYNNVSPYITDETGARIIIFRTTVNVGLGDYVTVTGVIGQYNSVNQIAQGNTLVIDQAHECEYETTVTAPTCTVAGYTSYLCPICADTYTDNEVEATGHNYENGVCTICEHKEGGNEQVVTTASKTIASLISDLGWTSSTTKQSFKLDDNVSVKINGGSNTGKAYNGDHIRIYATDTPAGTITISVPEGYELVSVKVTTQTGTYAYLYVDGTTTDICNKTVSVSGNSVVLNSVKNGSDGKQVRVTAIEVVYQTV